MGFGFFKADCGGGFHISNKNRRNKYAQFRRITFHESQIIVYYNDIARHYLDLLKPMVLSLSIQISLVLVYYSF